MHAEFGCLEVSDRDECEVVYIEGLDGAVDMERKRYSGLSSPLHSFYRAMRDLF